MTTTKSTVTFATLTHATIDGQQHLWTDLIDAATQDYKSREIGVRPNGDAELADAYRQLLRDCLPLVHRLLREAYDRYCTMGVTTRDNDSVHSIGHGNWSSGPDKQKQAAYMEWDALASRIVKASIQP